MRSIHRVAAAVATSAAVTSARLFAADTFTVAAYNVESWNAIERRDKPNQPKPADERQAVWNVLAQVRPDVLGLVEMGTTNDLAEFSEGLRRLGLEFPHVEWIQGSDSDRHVALLSRFPIAQRLSRTDYTYVLDGKSHRVQRGFLDVRVQVNERYSFRALVAHLKSKRRSSEGDQASMRLEEAKLLRAHVGKAIKDDPRLNLIVMGDFNDTPDSEPIRALVGEPPFALFDLMPVDSKGGHDTHLWRWKGEYSRIDYLLTSPGMSNEFVAGSARIADIEGWDKGSDHRAISAQFRADDRAGGGTGSSQVLNDRRFWLVVMNLVTILAVGGVLIFFTKRHFQSAG
jgi:endonuclease/exonuclease/phosphatase family metal-dependent hydrolase